MIHAAAAEIEPEHISVVSSAYCSNKEGTLQGSVFIKLNQKAMTLEHSPEGYHPSLLPKVKTDGQT